MKVVQPDSIPDEVRGFLFENFTDVRDEARQGDYYVFSLKNKSRQLRFLRVHRKFFVYSLDIKDHFEKYGFLDQLERGDVDIVEPIR